MKRLLGMIVLLALSANAYGLRNGCIPGTTGCADCNTNPTDPLCGPGGSVSRLSGHCDVDGNGHTDLLWWDQSYYNVKVWKMNGIGRIGDGQFLSPRRIADPNWRVVGTGYFDADEKTDLLWQNEATGEMRIWTMDQTTRTGDVLLVCPSQLEQCTDPSPAWKVVATGFFGPAVPQHDGKSDIVFRSESNGSLMIWIMDGTTVKEEVRLRSHSTSSDPAWRVEGSGFFGTGYRDRYSDILWYNRRDGRVRVWNMESTSLSNEVTLSRAEPDTNWKLIGAGEFSRDEVTDINEYPDLVWRQNHTGQLRVWIKEGTTWTTVNTSPDGRSDLTWKPIAK